eukprot:TRINITY_DN11558_c0_g2_i2.p1 TRINITY_DN11558_c0_g2~~TRINITY_DN11558_c0_g2_i2.p1  ORF type:complete len:109 (-),score=11.97 TRINITY_DN11558_c0_g2_i2:307-633(-)
MSQSTDVNEIVCEGHKHLMRIQKHIRPARCTFVRVNCSFVGGLVDTCATREVGQDGQLPGYIEWETCSQTGIQPSFQGFGFVVAFAVVYLAFAEWNLESIAKLSQTAV